MIIYGFLVIFVASSKITQKKTIASLVKKTSLNLLQSSSDGTLESIEIKGKVNNSIIGLKHAAAHVIQYRRLQRTPSVYVSLFAAYTTAHSVSPLMNYCYIQYSTTTELQIPSVWRRNCFLLLSAPVISSNSVHHTTPHSYNTTTRQHIYIPQRHWSIKGPNCS